MFRTLIVCFAVFSPGGVLAADLSQEEIDALVSQTQALRARMEAEELDTICVDAVLFQLQQLEPAPGSGREPEPPPPTGDFPQDPDAIVLKEDTAIDSEFVFSTLVVRNCKLTLLPGAVLICEDGTIDKTIDPSQLSRGLIVEHGGELEAFGTWKTPWVRAVTDVRAGDDMIILDRMPQGWKAGDRLVIAPGLPEIEGKYGDFSHDPHDEERVIQSVNGEMVTLDKPLDIDHPRSPFGDGVHIANMTRDIKICSANPENPGHGMAHHMGQARLNNVEFVDFGRTKATEHVDKWGFEQDTRADALGITNHLARYAWHWHQLGDGGASSLGETNYAKGCTFTRSRKWAVTVHDTNHVLVEDCVAYKTGGAGFVAEGRNDVSTFRRCGAINTGVEGYRSMLRHPHGVHRIHDHPSTGGTEVLFSFGFRGDGFWCRTGVPDVLDCWSAGHNEAGFNDNGYYDTWALSVCNPKNGGRPAGLRENLESYCGAHGYWSSWPFGTNSSDLISQPIRAYRNCDGWQLTINGTENWHTINEHFINWRLENTPYLSDHAVGHSKHPESNAQVGLSFHIGYESGGFVVKDCTVKGFHIGVWTPPITKDEHWFYMTGGKLDNLVNIMHVGTSSQPRNDCRIDNVALVHEAPMLVPKVWKELYSHPNAPVDVWSYEHVDYPTFSQGVGDTSLLVNGVRYYYEYDPNRPLGGEVRALTKGNLAFPEGN